MVVSPKEVPDKMSSVNESLSSLETVIVVVVLPLLTDITSQEPVTSALLVRESPLSLQAKNVKTIVKKVKTNVTVLNNELMKPSLLGFKVNIIYFTTVQNSQAEIDYVIQNQTAIIPIEVKAGQRGSMQSLHLFLEEKKSPYGIRTSLENRAKMEKIKVVPLYEIGRIVE